MTAKRRLLIASGLILASGVGWFYWFYFKSPEAVLRHAEAFHLRRMTVAQLETGRGLRLAGRWATGRLLPRLPLRARSG